MGQRARQVVEAEFTEELVDRAYLQALAPIVSLRAPSAMMPSLLRIFLALAWVVVAVVYISRSAFVANYADLELARAERVWPDHPTVLSARAMLDVAKAAAKGRPLEKATRVLVADVARAEPLAPEPFVIVGAEAQRNGNTAAAERLLLHARRRDPRAPAAHFLLAQQYISQGRLRRACRRQRRLPGSCPAQSNPSPELSRATSRLRACQWIF